MITILITLSCDGCKKEPYRSKVLQDTVFRRDLEAVRNFAHSVGWRRFRLKNTAPNGDYCPDCQQLMDRAKPGKKAHAQKT